MPALERPDDVIVRVDGAGVCHTDVHLWQGVWADASGRAMGLPQILGHENVGRVHAVGAEGTRMGLRPGMPVVCHPMNACGTCRQCRQGNDMLCESGREPGIHGLSGGFAEYMRTTARSLIPTSADSGNLAELAPFADAGLTAYHAVRRAQGGLTAGSSCLVVGIGGLGQFAVQILRAVTPSRIIAADTVLRHLEIAKELGADDVVHVADAGFAGQVCELTGGVDVAFDFVGESDTLEEAVRSVCRGGTLSIVGYGGEMALASRVAVQRELVVQGNLAGSYVDLLELIALRNRGLVRSSYRTYPLSEASEVLAQLAAGTLEERAVLVPA